MEPADNIAFIYTLFVIHSHFCTAPSPTLRINEFAFDFTLKNPLSRVTTMLCDLPRSAAQQICPCACWVLFSKNSPGGGARSQQTSQGPGVCGGVGRGEEEGAVFRRLKEASSTCVLRCSWTGLSPRPRAWPLLPCGRGFFVPWFSGRRSLPNFCSRFACSFSNIPSVSTILPGVSTRSYRGTTAPVLRVLTVGTVNTAQSPRP